MEFTPPTVDLFRAYLAPFTALAGDRRTGRLLGDIVQGIIGSGSLICAQIAAFSPWAGQWAA